MSTLEFAPPGCLATVTYADVIFGFMTVPGLAWTTTADALNVDNTDIGGARYIDPWNTLEGNAKLKRQDTYLSGTGSRTGRAFTASGGGTWKDDRQYGPIGKYILLNQDSTASSVNTPTITSVDTTTGIEPCEILLGRGWPPVSGSVDTYTIDNNYVYIELASGSSDKKNFRIALEYGRPIALDWTDDAGTTWQRVQQCRDFASVQRYFDGVDGNYLRIGIRPDVEKGVLTVEIGDGHYMVYAPELQRQDDGTLKDATNALPTTGKIKVTTKNGWTAFGYFPYRFENITVKKPAKRPIDARIDTQDPLFIINTLARREGEKLEGTLTKSDDDTIGFTVTSKRDDAGDGLGATDPPRLSDVTVILPAEYTFDLGADDGEQPIDPNIDYGVLPTKTTDELEVWDDNSCSYYHTAVLTCSNAGQIYTGSWGRVAINLIANTDGYDVQRMLGYAGDGQNGIVFRSAFDSLHTFQLPVSDRSVSMQVPLNDECIFDNWAWPSIVWFLAREKGNIHEQWLEYIPKYVPPDGTDDMPYGPAGDDCPWYIPFRGLGGQPLGRFMPTDTPWDILLQLAQSMTETDPTTGLQVPYFVGFDAYGFLHFEPVYYWDQDAAVIYSDLPFDGTVPIEGEIQVYNSAQQLRTDLHFQSIDPRTAELLYQYLPMPTVVKRACGFAYPWVERSARFGDEEGLDYVINSAVWQAGLNVQTVRFKTFYRPEVRAGMVCLVASLPSLGGIMRGVITKIRSRHGQTDPLHGSPSVDCYSIVEVRNIFNML